MILNGATGAIGGVVIQLCAMLKLRAIAVVRRHETGPASDPVKVEKRLKALGAAEVLVETDKMGSVGLKMGAFIFNPRMGNHTDVVFCVQSSRTTSFSPSPSSRSTASAVSPRPGSRRPSRTGASSCASGASRGSR